VYQLQRFADDSASRQELCERSMSSFSQEVTDLVTDACIRQMQQLEQRLLEFGKNAGTDADIAAVTGAVQATNSFLAPAAKTKAEEFSYTMAAARRTERRRLISFVQLADYVVSDMLHTLLLTSAQEVLQRMQSKQSKPGLPGPAGQPVAVVVPVVEVALELDEYNRLVLQPPPADFKARVTDVSGCSWRPSCVNE
jgi:hypothetical protein